MGLQLATTTSSSQRTFIPRQIALRTLVFAQGLHGGPVSNIVTIVIRPPDHAKGTERPRVGQKAKQIAKRGDVCRHDANQRLLLYLFYPFERREDRPALTVIRSVIVAPWIASFVTLSNVKSSDPSLYASLGLLLSSITLPSMSRLQRLRASKLYSGPCRPINPAKSRKPTN